MKKVFISSPFRGNIEKNTELACDLARQTIQMGHIPILPHLYFPQILDDSDPRDRGTGMALGLMLMHECDMMVTAGEPSEGMALEIAYWKTIKNVEPIQWSEFTARNFKNVKSGARPILEATPRPTTGKTYHP